MTIGPVLAQPDDANAFQDVFVRRVVASYARVTGGDLIAEAGLDPNMPGRSAWLGNFALLTHRGDAEAILNYGNAFALKLWECDWQSFTSTPSDKTAPAEDRALRSEAMEKVASSGFVKGYSGRRISLTGRLFLIKNVTIWQLLDGQGISFGVAAFFRDIARL